MVDIISTLYHPLERADRTDTLEKGLSQEQLAHMAGISTRTLQRIERGDVEVHRLCS